MEYLLGLVALLFGGLVFYRTKAKSAGALLQNLDTKNQLNQEDKNIVKDQGLQQVEEERRNQIESDIEKAKNDPITNKDLTDFFNKR